MPSGTRTFATTSPTELETDTRQCHIQDSVETLGAGQNGAIL